MAFYGLIWPFMATYVIVFYGLSWQNIDLSGLVLSFLAVIDPNSFGLVLFKISKFDLNLVSFLNYHHTLNNIRWYYYNLFLC